MRGPFSMPRFNRGAHKNLALGRSGVNAAPAGLHRRDAAKDGLRETRPGSWPA